MLSRNGTASIEQSASGSRMRERDADDARGAVSRLVQGQAVVVRPAAEILATLDADFTFEGLPFMPEMLKYCGRRMTVHRRANKTCVEGYGLRAIHDTVLLVDSYCDGAAHDGCQKHCLNFWKEAWLAPVDGADVLAAVPDAPPFDDLYRTLAAATRDGEQYKCQSTLLHKATRPLSSFGLVEFFQDFVVGQLTLGKFLMMVRRALSNRLRSVFGIAPIGTVRGPSGPHSKGDLELQPGEYVEVRSIDEISRAVGPSGKNRGLLFEPDMRAAVGKRFEVEFRIEKIISEETGKMIHLTNTVALKNVHCTGECTNNCPRAQALYWREAWVKRVSPGV